MRGVDILFALSLCEDSVNTSGVHVSVYSSRTMVVVYRDDNKNVVLI